MVHTRRNRQGLLARVNFPLYTVQMLTSRHILVGGGGGTAKTGVANGFEIFELSHDGERFIAEEVVRHETGSSVVMNCSAFSNAKSNFIVAGQESHCQLYIVNTEVVIDSEVEDLDGQSNGVRKRRNSVRKQSNSNNNKRLMFRIKTGDSVQTDFFKGEPLQRVVRICPLGKIMATGGTDGKVRLWKFPNLQQLYVLKAHSKEIDDVDFCPFSNYIATLAKDGLAVLWSCKTGKEISRLIWKQPEGSKYLYKRCRFGKVEGSETNVSALFTLANPTGLAKKQKSYLQRWNPTDGTLTKVAAVDESLSALAVRDDGRFVALGTMFSGSVSIYVAFSLQKVLHISGAHSMFVTGLEFLPVATDEHTVTSISEAAVISISVDNQVCVHSLPYRRSMPIWLAILLIVMVLMGTFLFCSYLGI